MKTHHLTTPIKNEDLEGIEIGDIVYLSGYLITSRDDVHMRLVKQHRPLPVDLAGKAIFHAGPIMVPCGDESGSGYKVVSIGPTTSMRMEKFEREFIRDTGVKIIVGKGGSEIEKLRVELEKMIKKNVNISIVEVRSPDLNAQLVAENIAAQLEKRVSFRRAMKQAIGRAMKLGAKGIKVSVSGRLGGAEIARTEHYHDGTIPLQTLRADIDYGFAEANTTYGRIGVKVWLYKGEILTGGPRTTEVEAPRRDRRDRRDGDRRNNRNGRGGNRQGGYQNRNGQGNRQGGYQNRGNGGYRNQNNGQGAPAARPPKTEGGAQ